MSKRPINTGDPKTISAGHENDSVVSGPESQVASERAHARLLIDELIRSLSETRPAKPLPLPANPPYETVDLLCRMLINDLGQPNPAIAETLQQINNLFPESSFNDIVSTIVNLNVKNQSNVELDRILNEVLDNTQPDSRREKRPKFLTDTLVTAPADAGYAELSQNLEALNRDFRREIASRLEPALNAHVQAMPHDTYEEKKTLAKWVNEELRRFDLAIKCPKTGEPSILLVGVGNHPEIGRFILEHKTPEGKRVRTVHTPDLPHLELTEANPRREALMEWRDKVGGQRGDAGRE